jgi:hypothetical protein
MGYYLKDVEAVESAVKRVRPTAVTHRFDYGFGLSVEDGEGGGSFILFRPARFEGESEISTSVEEAEDFAFMLGSQWTPDEISKMTETRKPT